MKKIISLLILTIQLQCVATAQLLDVTSSYLSPKAASYVRLLYDNDYFTTTDYYYSQGVTLDVVTKASTKADKNTKNPLKKILYSPKIGTKQYGISANIYGYTPTSISSDSILYGDRPFNANASLQLYSITTATNNRVVSKLTVGYMGPKAKGYEIQEGIHKSTGNIRPLGWQHQIRSALILNYQINYEGKWLQKNYVTMNKVLQVKVGTQYNKLTFGSNIVLGNNALKKRKASFSFFIQPTATAVLYDATMQGNIFKKNSPYFIAAKDVTRVVLQADAGIVLNLPKLQLAYTQSIITKEFATGLYHRWGGIRIGKKI